MKLQSREAWSRLSQERHLPSLHPNGAERRKPQTRPEQPFKWRSRLHPNPQAERLILRPLPKQMRYPPNPNEPGALGHISRYDIRLGNKTHRETERHHEARSPTYPDDHGLACPPLTKQVFSLTMITDRSVIISCFAKLPCLG
jgi:hypothetical protein